MDLTVIHHPLLYIFGSSFFGSRPFEHGERLTYGLSERKSGNKLTITVYLF